MNSFNPRPLKPLDPSETATKVSLLPRVQIADNLADENLVDLENENDIKITKYESPEQIENCLTVSGLPNSRWISLVNLKLIKQRNKVKEKTLKNLYSSSKFRQ